MKFARWSPLPGWANRNLAILGSGLALGAGTAALGNVMGSGQGDMLAQRSEQQLTCAKALGEKAVLGHVSQVCLKPIYGEFPSVEEMGRTVDYLPTATDMRQRASANRQRAEALPGKYARTGVLFGAGVWALLWSMELSIGGTDRKASSRE